ncbi:MAG: class I SAM-dependent methyltransferase [Clostridia bacterium]|nr:class I SAM-dependent methyltransferase [Clostridia bacterium]
MDCKICGSKTYPIHDVQFDIIYHRCTSCLFVYEDSKFHISIEKELEEYNRHENSIEDEGYVNMFKRFQNAFESFVSGTKVLEFGSGPTPVFSQVLRKSSYEVTSFDPFYAPDLDYLNHSYDLITSTEVFEHIVEPIETLDTLVRLLRPGGILAIMTQFVPEDEVFIKWWYRRDPTHIGFYHHKTFEYLSQKYQLDILFKNDKDYMILKKN